MAPSRIVDPTSFQSNDANGLKAKALQETCEQPDIFYQDKRSIEVIRGLVLDCCQQWGTGHGGSALGMAAIAQTLWRHILRYDPAHPDWFDRDRFVLSNGHVGILQYILLHLSGYEKWTMQQLKGYCHPTALDFTSMTKTHPEIEFDGLDMSTGPLGQGIANAVGMAIANMNLRATFNTDQSEIILGRVYCSTGDACLQEGVALEAISLAGHLKLDNLTLIYDNNGIQCDGPITLTTSEDVNEKMRACGWYIIDVFDGNHDVANIYTAITYAKQHRGSPVFINIRTTIGHGTDKAGTHKAHHTSFGGQTVDQCKRKWNLDPQQTHYVPQEVRTYWAEIPKRGKILYQQWERNLEKYQMACPERAEQLLLKVHGRLPSGWMRLLHEFQPPNHPIPIRQASGQIHDYLWDTVSFIAGSADLSEPNFMLKGGQQRFGSPSHHDGMSYSGRYIHYGVREHAMMAIANGISAYSRGAFIPVTATFAMFQLYGAPAIRMSALARLPAIHIGTHDSIAEGACGPTHQPIELVNLFRSMPDILHIRPGDAEEAIGAWMMALSFDGPSIIGLNRHAVPMQSGTNRHKMQRGAYVLNKGVGYQVTLVSTGGDLFHAVEAAQLLKDCGVPTRIVSMPCMRRFEEQDEEYQRMVFPWDGRPVVSFEAMSTDGWAKYATASIGQLGFGTTVAAEAVYPHFKLTAEDVKERVLKYLDGLLGRNAHTVPWRNI
ncbi:putative transketolase [Aspergillus steynii IBT 23096]|uniref:Putative transketolase n=1 Tax=Aspergillus steynii IBT 23096 TaxID=1392250 RepID=A0A2I2GB55_9EURO|nr:putative transketolase [Aspergillus steynii IBT 23096]PLB50108.1 putative transketolase [Aspergillus steynii IBT 23096]